MRSIMAGFRSGITHIGFSKVEEECDYLKGLDDLPASDVLKFLLDGNCSVIIRPSGTEPKLKVGYRNAFKCLKGKEEELFGFISNHH